MNIIKVEVKDTQFALDVQSVKFDIRNDRVLLGKTDFEFVSLSITDFLAGHITVRGEFLPTHEKHSFRQALLDVDLYYHVIDELLLFFGWTGDRASYSGFVEKFEPVEREAAEVWMKAVEASHELAALLQP